MPRATALIVAMAALLAGCGRDDPPRSAEPAVASVESARRGHSDKGSDSPAGADHVAVTAAQTAARDLAIAAEVHRRLAGDGQLGATELQVVTSAGRVLLRGSTPDTEARHRSAALALGVVGVVSVVNDLSVQARAR